MADTLLKTMLVVAAVAGAAAEAVRADDRNFTEDVRPVLQEYCFDCHAGDVTEADVDFGAFKDLEDLRRDRQTWLKTRRMLDSGQMPPKDAAQPSNDERRLLQAWVRSFLKREAEATAGDPGPVMLRRLNNEEYGYTVRDLTGVTALDPTHEFPVDGAAGEGFINTSAAQAMSPSLVIKYLDAAKLIAAHAVLLPDGITFSAGRSRREWTDERIAAIRRFYDRFTVLTEVYVEVGGTGKVANQGGAVPLEEYLAATLEERGALSSGQKTSETVADERSLNAKYLRRLWDVLSTPVGESNSLLLEDLRRKWRQASPADAPELAARIKQFQEQLWKFNSIGQLTEGGRQKTWMEAVSPIVTRWESRLPLSPSANDSEVVVYLSADDLGDGRDQDFVVWDRPRFEFKADAADGPRPAILLRDVPRLAERIREMIRTEAPRTAQYLGALATAHTSGASFDEIASQNGLNTPLLKRWAELVELGHPSNREIRGHFTTKLERAHGYADVNGWGTPQTPSVLTNRSDADISFLTLTVPARGVVVHPSPTQSAVIAWRSPLEGRVQIAGRVADADDKCGNGAAWRVDLLSQSGTAIVAQGVFDNGRDARFQTDGEVEVRRDDVVSLIVAARHKNHTCDTTHVDLTLTEIGGDSRTWCLASDVVDRVLEANPLADSYGNAATWHFCSQVDSKPEPQPALIPGSALARWRAAVVDAKPARGTVELAQSVERILTTDDLEGLSEPDRRLHAQCNDWKGPLQWMAVAQAAPLPEVGKVQPVVNPPHGLGKPLNGLEIDSASLCMQAPDALELRLPASLVAGCEFVVSAELHPATGGDGSVQVQVSQTKPQALNVSPSLPILVRPAGTARNRVEAALADFRNLFPAALCYSRIVPVDEVVTLTLYFREDDHLRRLMLSEAEAAELDRLWDELLYVAQEPIALAVAFEQAYEFATQDRPDLVEAFGPMRDPINDRADAFRRRLVQTEPAHLGALVELADRAWRRTLSSSEQARLHDFYKQLRGSGIAHDAAVRLTLARVLASPAFLYRHEQPPPGKDAAPVRSTELATRLGYFLWSSLPDAELREVADSGRLAADGVLLEQTRRMLKDARTRRLAVQFACQWLHVRGFAENDDKNENLFPEFADLRDDMFEETVRFFEDMFRNDRSILDLLDADHTFLNEPLARHYGIEGVAGPEWRRVTGVRERGRGGVLGMATFLASQSGASRTSPILRGNWVYETLLGERLPRPPANVPQLPDEVSEELTARQLIEQHSSVAACARCHEKIDPFGFALERYDAIGRLRSAVVDTRTTLEDGMGIEGIDGLREYLLTRRREDVVRQFCRKLLGFALGREVLLSDEPLLDEMHHTLKAEDFRFHAAVEMIVASPQFRNIRGRDAVSDQDLTGALP